MIIDNPNHIELYRMITQKQALKLELVGLKTRGRTAYSLIKEELGMKGSRENVLKQMNLLLDSMKKKNLKGRGIA